MPVSIPSGTVLPDLSPAVTQSGTNANVFSFAGSLQNEYDYQIDGASFSEIASKTNSGIVDEHPICRTRCKQLKA